MMAAARTPGQMRAVLAVTPSRYVGDARIVSRAELDWLLAAWRRWRLDLEESWSPLWRRRYLVAKAAHLELKGCGRVEQDVA